MPAAIENLRRFFAAASAAGVAAELSRAAAAELIAILDRPEPDRRRVATYELSRAIARLKSKGIPRAAICERLGVSIHQYYRADAVSRDSRYPFPADSVATEKETV